MDPLAAFIALTEEALGRQAFGRLVLSKRRPARADPRPGAMGEPGAEPRSAPSSDAGWVTGPASVQSSNDNAPPPVLPSSSSSARSHVGPGSVVRPGLNLATAATRIVVRPVELKGDTRLSFVYTHATRDITKNLTDRQALDALAELLTDAFGHAHLFTDREEIQLLTSKKGRRTLLRHDLASVDLAPQAHDRAKHRYLSLDRPFLSALGVTDAEHRLIPAMARKWKQINKFVEVLDHALAASTLQATALGRSSHPGSSLRRAPLADSSLRGTLLDNSPLDDSLQAAPAIEVVDFGSGKGYLTFAVHDHLRHALGRTARVAGIELRDDLVALCNSAAQDLGLDGLRFEQGDVRSRAPAAIDIMIALHACDTATDHAIYTGLRAGAAIIMCSPCCHKELRPQLLSPHPLRPILKHGVHLGQQAEMLTDGLRALLLEACGYETQVFEFVALEHTNKNKMILAVKRARAVAPDALWQQIDDLKSFYGVQAQCLETLLRGEKRSASSVGAEIGTAPAASAAPAEV